MGVVENLTRVVSWHMYVHNRHNGFHEPSGLTQYACQDA